VFSLTNTAHLEQGHILGLRLALAHACGGTFQWRAAEDRCHTPRVLIAPGALT
jgi:hypothetical protein